MPNKNPVLCWIEKCGQQEEIIEELGVDLINSLLGGDVSATLTVGAAVGDVISVTVQMVDAEGAALAAAYSAWAWLSDTAAAAVTADAPDGGTAATTGTILQEHATDVSLDFLTDASGVFVLAITESGVDTWFLNVRLPSGLVVSSAAITFA
jgi:hypothetical protein